MIVSAKFAALKGIKFHEFALRFLFGGVCTVAAGILAKRFGPEVGGLFLAFPAIFPAGASLIEKHERQHKRRIGYDGTNRGRAASSIDAAGASLGCIGLAAFALKLLAPLCPGTARGWSLRSQVSSGSRCPWVFGSSVRAVSPTPYRGPSDASPPGVFEEVNDIPISRILSIVDADRFRKRSGYSTNSSFRTMR